MSDNDLTDPKKVDRLIKGAKSGVNFAFDAGSKTMAADKSKSGKALAKILDAKSSDEAYGRVTVDGKLAVFDLEKGEASYQKLLNDWMRKNGLGSLQAAIGGDDVTDDDEDDPDEDEDGEKVLQQDFIRLCLKKSRRVPQHFGFGIGKEADMLAVHPRRPGLKLARLVKKRSRAVKLAYGTLALEGRLLRFDCINKPVTGMKKRTISLLKSGGPRPPGQDLRA